jgi:hypothetical protein
MEFHLIGTESAILTERQFMMDFELKLEKPNAARAWISALTLALSYFLGKHSQISKPASSIFMIFLFLFAALFVRLSC